MNGTLIEIAATLAESLIRADFCVRYVSSKTKKKTILCFCGIFLWNVIVTSVLNAFMSFEGVYGFMRVCGDFALMTLLMRGKWYERLFPTLFVEMFEIVLSLSMLGLFSSFFHMDLEAIMTEYSPIRLFCLLVNKLLLYFISRLILKIQRRRSDFLSGREWFLFFVVFVLTSILGIEICVLALKEEEAPSVILTVCALVLGMVDVLVYALILQMSRKNRQILDEAIDQAQMEYYQEQARQWQESLERDRQFRHDFQNHIQCILTLLQNCETQEAQEYIRRWTHQTAAPEKVCFPSTGNKVADAILYAKMRRCAAKNIRVTMKTVPFAAQVTDIDLCVILGNLWDNAMEACEKSSGEREIVFTMHPQKSYVHIRLQNTIAAPVLAENPALRSVKSTPGVHGIGLRSVHQKIKQCGGVISFHDEENRFCADVLLPAVR